MKKIGILLGSLLLSLVSQAQYQNTGKPSPFSTNPTSSWSSFGGQTHEVDVNFSQAQIHSYKIGNNSYTDINILGSYHYLLQSRIQVGAEVGLLSYPDTGTSNKTFFALMGTGHYNFDFDLTSSFFVGAGLGLYPAFDNNKYDSKVSFMFEGGKRIPLWSHVSYKPVVRFMKRGSMDMEFFIEALNISLMF